MTLKIHAEVDQKFIDTAEEEAYQALLYQANYYRDWWNRCRRPKWRMAGVLLSIIGFIASVSMIMYLKTISSGCVIISTTEFELYSGVFLLLMLFFFFSKTAKKTPNWAVKFSERNCKKIANFCVKNAKQQLPFDAEYEIQNGILCYYRLKDGSRNLVWNRPLNGVAVCGNTITLIFKKWTSVSPIITILHQDYQQINTVLENQNIETKNPFLSTMQIKLF